jgi:hypothetical protein
MFGILAGVGAPVGYGQFTNLALEGAVKMANWRLYAQGGYVSAFSGQADAENGRDSYVALRGTYYITPNFAVSGGVEADWWRDDSDGGTNYDTVSWMARVEHKLGDAPVSAYLAYFGNSWSGSDDDFDGNGTGHSIVVGLRFLLGAQSVEELDGRVGLTDMNPGYGNGLH